MKPGIEVVPDPVAEGMWVVEVNGAYITHELYRGDAEGIAARLRRSLDPSKTSD